MGDPGVNAFAMPGGYIGVNPRAGAIDAIRKRTRQCPLHEMAHMTQKHYASHDGRSAQNAWIGIAGLVVPCWRHQGKGRRGAGCAAGHPGTLRCRVTSIFARQ